MTKDDFKRVVREKMKGYGFSSRQGRYYKMIGNDYLIGVSLDHSPYTNGYYVEYGVVYLPDEEKYPFRGWYDWESRFKFTCDGSAELEGLHPGIYGRYDTDLVGECAGYEYRSEENLAHELDVNYEKCIVPLFDKEFALNDYRSDWTMFRVIPYDDVKKICRLAGLDYEEVKRVRDGRITKWPL